MKSRLLVAALVGLLHFGAHAQPQFSQVPLFDLDQQGEMRTIRYMNEMEVRIPLQVRWTEQALNRAHQYVRANRDRPAADGTVVCFAPRVGVDPRDCDRLNNRLTVFEQSYLINIKITFKNGRAPFVDDMPLEDDNTPSQLRSVTWRGTVIYERGVQRTHFVVRLPIADAASICEIYFAVVPQPQNRPRVRRPIL